MKKILYILLIALFCFACKEKDPAEDPVEDDFTGISGVFIDSRDGYQYEWVRINGQIWMAQNLAYLPSVNLHTTERETMCESLEFTEPHFHVYGYSGIKVDQAKATLNYSKYGVLYNWYAATKSCPKGWHLPTDEEWENLAAYISAQKGPYQRVNQNWIDEGPNWLGVGKHLKATYSWESSGNGTDDFGFSAVAGGGSYGVRDEFSQMGFFTKWWSSSEFSSTDALVRGVNYGTPTFDNYNIHKIDLCSVRCIKD